MVATEPNVNPEARYTIGQTVELLGMSRNTVKKYTDSGQLRHVVHKATGKKLYTGQAIALFWRTMA